MAIPHTRSGLFTLFENDEDEQRHKSAISLSSIAKNGIPWSTLDMSMAEPVACSGTGIILKGRYGSSSVILKVMQPDQLRMLKCLKKLLSLNHDNLVKLYGICPDDDLVAYKHVSVVMGYCCNGSLKKRIVHNRPINKNAFTKWSYQIAVGMDYLHREGIAHRNLKPQNILLDGGKNIQVGGFSLCKEMRGADGNTFCGTALYMAPEVVAGPRHSKQVDVWSYGVILREMLTQVHPYALRSTASIVLELGDIATIKRWPEGFTLLPPKDCPTKLLQLIRDCLAPDYRARPGFDDILNGMRDIEDEIEKVDEDEWNTKKKSWRSIARKEKRKSVC
ncbi:Mitogen-activated protein kinase kinase kinase dlk-1 [Toxocara canis]|uniref:Mitogen-activated protein kinase kinase kinase dlk-1 n=1 Tax=Toxocara canis TaxID=6265 RepID=A0A0B2VNS6_TOXCA|nr:Mitogen-activated protein kinase kinase kinase dlk-1 [Toxocara canis]